MFSGDEAQIYVPVCIVRMSFSILAFSPKLLLIINEPGHEKMCLMPYANNRGADHPRSLISAFVVRCQDRMVPPVCTSETSRF